MRGTLLCGVVDSDDGHDALELAAELSDRLGLRLVLAHVVDDAARPNVRAERVSPTADREGAAQGIARLAAEHGLADVAEQRSAVGDPAALLGQIAAEEAADLIVVGARPRGWLRRGLDSRLAHELETTTTVPVVIAPPRGQRRSERLGKSGGRR